MKSDNFKGSFLVVLGGSLWGFSGACAQYLFINYSIDPVWLTAYRMAFAGFVLTLVLFCKNKTKVFSIFKNKRDMKDFFVFAFIGLLMCQLTYLLAIKYSNSGTATVIQYTSPALIIFWVCLRTPRLPKAKEVIAVIFALIGTFLIATHGRLDTLVISKQALIYGLISAAGVVVYNIAPKEILKKYGAMNVLGLGMLTSGVVFGVFTLSFTKFLLRTPDAILAFLGLSILGALAAFTIYLKGITYIGPVKGSVLASAEPVVSTIISHFWLGTEFAKADLIGFAFIIAIVFISAHKEEIKNVQTA
ncbi:MAG: DMT family transporter [Clostridiales bacterium]|nr:DMT family transporter [Clostridiales bacterium]